MRILVTGGAGFIASHIVDVYIDAGHDVAIIDNISTGKRKNLHKDATFFEGDITDQKFVSTVFGTFKPQVVSHHAAQVSVAVSSKNIRFDADQNIIGTVTILDAMREHGIKQIIYSSSGGTIYGVPEDEAVTEDHQSDPRSPYAMSKYVGEMYIRMYGELFGIEGTILRYGNVYGPRQDPHGEAGICAIFTPKMLAGEQVTVFGGGVHTRDYIYVGDVATANLAALKGKSGTYNIGTGVGTKTMTVFEILSAATNHDKEPNHAPERPGEVMGYYLIPHKAKEHLGWEPAHTFAEGIEKTVAWYRESNQ